MLDAHHIHYYIGNRSIVNRASMQVLPGELTAIIGPNGAGKSTLFRLLSGEMPCKQGKITYNGQSIQGMKSRQLASLRAVMPQHSTLTFPFQAKEVVALGLMHCRPKYPKTILKEVMSATQTWHLKDQTYGSLSGGEKQRVQLARVLAQIWEIKPIPRYLLLDEPTSSMDIAQQHHIMQIIGQLKQRNIGILAILHDLNLAANYADKALLLKQGTVLNQGSIRTVMTPENLKQVFDYPLSVQTNGPNDPIYISSLPPNATSTPNYTYKLA
ncbi:heme ABC transporter ATP-binding protein [Cyclobacterium xiamenense]|uniref:heme ABC transporter ATP-binding protein n=1 Tax=Cyclobacterium xiamenense TaxID=1297121 RepID=UPI0035D009B9